MVIKFKPAFAIESINSPCKRKCQPRVGSRPFRWDDFASDLIWVLIFAGGCGGTSWRMLQFCEIYNLIWSSCGISHCHLGRHTIHFRDEILCDFFPSVTISMESCSISKPIKNLSRFFSETAITYSLVVSSIFCVHPWTRSKSSVFVNLSELTAFTTGPNLSNRIRFPMVRAKITSAVIRGPDNVYPLTRKSLLREQNVVDLTFMAFNGQCLTFRIQYHHAITHSQQLSVRHSSTFDSLCHFGQFCQR